MAEITKALSIDVARANVFQAVVAKQNDSNSRFLEVTIMNEGAPIEIAQNSTVTINAAREDGNSKSFLGTVGSDGKVVVPLTNWMLALDGNVRCDITIVDSENRKLTTTSFMIAVEEAAYLGTDISEDEDYDLLTQLLTDCTTAKTACETAAAQANSAVENLDSTIEEKISELQPALTFDTKPTKGSTNPVTSDGVNTAINNLGVATAGELARYVLKETGKGLSSNDYTDAEKQKNADNESHIGNLSELSKSMFGSTSVDKPKSLVQAINTMAGVVDGKAASNIVGIKLLESSEGNPRPLTYLTRGLYYIKGPCSLTNAHGTYTYTFDNLVNIEFDELDFTTCLLTVYEPTGITFLSLGSDSTEIEKKTYSYDQFITATDYASESMAGVAKVKSIYGAYVSSADGTLQLMGATDDNITRRNTAYRPITPANLNTAVKAALTDSNHISDMTDTEKAMARGVVGAATATEVKQWFAANTVYAITVMLNDHSDNRITHMSGDLQSLTLSFPTSIEMGYECSFSFKSGSQQAISLNYPDDTVKFVGVDCDEDGDLIPTTNRNYEVIIKNLATDGATPVLVARVGVY